MIDKWGDHKVIEQSNGIKIKILKNPSIEYIEKQKLKREIELKQREVEIKQIKKQKLIQKYLEEHAETELIKSGLLNELGEPV